MTATRAGAAGGAAMVDADGPRFRTGAVVTAAYAEKVDEFIIRQ
jgi:hypothetical protein